MNEIRNELLYILAMMKRDTTDENGKENQQLDLEQLLERFEYDIKKQLKDIEYKEEELKNNLETLYYVRKELNINK